MYSNFKAQAIEYVKEAVQEDNAGNYAKAFPLYMNALEYFKTHLKYEKDPKIKDAINKKFTEYLHRAEEIRAVLDDSRTRSGSSGGDIATRPKDGENGEDSDPSKLTAELNFVPISSFKEQAIVYVKQAVQEDNDGNYNKAFSLYMNALEYFKTYLKYEKNPKMNEAITIKFNEYLCRAEKIRAMLNEGGSTLGPNGDASMATWPKTKPEDGEDGEGSK